MYERRPADDWHECDREMLARLCQMWDLADPPPAGLADEIVSRLAVADLVTEWAELQLTQQEVLGVRSVSEVQTLEFILGNVALIIRVAPDTASSDRIDGWLTSDDAGGIGTDAWVALITDDKQHASAPIDENGRFEFAGLRGQRWRLRFTAAHGARLQTPEIHW